MSDKDTGKTGKLTPSGKRPSITRLSPNDPFYKLGLVIGGKCSRPSCTRP